MYRKGWFGDPQGHSRAAKGIRLYAKKEDILIDPVFFAKKREQIVGTYSLVNDIRNGATLQELVAKYPDAEQEDLRRRGMKAIEMRGADDTLTLLDRNGIEQSAKMAEKSPDLRRRMRAVLKDKQQSSFLHPKKVDFLSEKI